MKTPLKITVNLLNFFSQVHIFPAYIYLQKSVFRMWTSFMQSSTPGTNAPLPL